IDSPLPSSFHAPSIWYEEVAAPQTKSAGKVWRSLIRLWSPVFPCWVGAGLCQPLSILAAARRLQHVVIHQFGDRHSPGTGGLPRQCELAAGDEMLRLYLDEGRGLGGAARILGGQRAAVVVRAAAGIARLLAFQGDLSHALDLLPLLVEAGDGRHEHL